MHIVERADALPGHCCVVPHLGGQHPGKYIDTGNYLVGVDNKVYVSLEGLKILNKVAGWPTGDEHQRALDALTEALIEVERLKGELHEANRLLDAIDVMESADFRARRKPGRPKKEVAA